VRATAPGRRFFRHPTAGPGVFVLTFFVTIAFAAPVVAPYPPYYQIDIEHPNHPPSAQFLLGTDPLSRDVWSRVVYGARVSLGIGAVAMLVAASVGTAVGAVAGYFRRWVDTTLMRLVDVGLAMPRIFVLLMAVALWEHIALWVLVLLIGLTGWFGTSRLVRAEVLSLRSRRLSTSARTRRLVPNHPVSPMSSTRTHRAMCSHSATAIRRTKMRGIARPTSTSRMSAVSTQRRKYPATAPTAVPIVAATSMATAPIPRDTRAPYTSRLHTSRLYGSVPSRN